MDVLEYRDYCLSLPLAEETTPFDETTLVYKICGRMFTYASMVDFHRFAVKCDPERAIALRERYVSITPAWHSSKVHWNDVYVDGDLPDELVREQIRNSYLLVATKNVTPKSKRDELLQYLSTVELPR